MQYGRPIPAGNHAVPASGRAPPCLDALAKRAIQRQFAHRKIPAGNHAVPASGKAPSLPSYVCKTSALKLGACDAWTQGGGMCFACRSGATARRAGPRGTLAREVDVRTTRQAARDLGSFLCHGGHFSGATKPKHVPPPIADSTESPRIDGGNLRSFSLAEPPSRVQLFGLFPRIWYTKRYGQSSGCLFHRMKSTEIGLADI